MIRVTEVQGATCVEIVYEFLELSFRISHVWLNAEKFNLSVKMFANKREAADYHISISCDRRLPR